LASLSRSFVSAEVPPKVEYFLTDFEKSLVPMLEEIARWGRNLAEFKGKIMDNEKKRSQKK
jgi:DNA-binding HxlR family transcriptional regulator